MADLYTQLVTTPVGKQVSYTASDGSPASGVVSGVQNAAGAVSLDVGGTSVDPSTVTAVTNTAPATGTTGTTAAGGSGA